jgi:hypothetical protein
MILPLKVTDAEVKQFAEDLRRFMSSLLRLESGPWRLSFKVMAGGAAFGVVIGAITAAGQISVVGLQAAWALYGFWWTLAPFIGAAAPAMLFLLLLMFYGGGETLSRAVNATLSDRGREILDGVFYVYFFMFGLGMLAAAPFLAARQQAQESQQLLASPKLSSLTAIRSAAEQQREALTGVSRDGQKLLAQLDTVTNSLQTARNKLGETLKSVEARSREADRAADEVSRLTNEQHQIELRLAEFRRILNGGEPITRHDLVSSSRYGFLLGLVSGFVTSLAATFLYGWLTKPEHPQT